MSQSPQHVRLLDAFDVADLDTFVGRAKTADPEGAVRLTAHGSVLLLTVRLVPGAGLLGAGGVLGLRVVGVAAADSPDSPDGPDGPDRRDPAPGAASDAEPGADPSVDVVVSLESVSDRLARMRRTGDLDLAIPPVQVFAPWAGHAPPRTGWEALGLLDIDAVRAVAEAGIAEIATGAGQGGGPPTAGALAVDELRRRVWTRPAPDLAGGPAGLAFGAHALGFLPREQRSTPASTVRTPPVLYRHGPWWRLSTAAGHVIAR